MFSCSISVRMTALSAVFDWICALQVFIIIIIIIIKTKPTNSSLNGEIGKAYPTQPWSSQFSLAACKWVLCFSSDWKQPLGFTSLARIMVKRQAHWRETLAVFTEANEGNEIISYHGDQHKGTRLGQWWWTRWEGVGRRGGSQFPQEAAVQSQKRTDRRQSVSSEISVYLSPRRQIAPPTKTSEAINTTWVRTRSLICTTQKSFIVVIE